MEKVIKFSDIGSQRQTFNQHAGPILIKTMDINKIRSLLVYLIRSLLVKKI